MSVLFRYLFVFFHLRFCTNAQITRDEKFRLAMTFQLLVNEAELEQTLSSLLLLLVLMPSSLFE